MSHLVFVSFFLEKNPQSQKKQYPSIFFTWNFQVTPPAPKGVSEKVALKLPLKWN